MIKYFVIGQQKYEKFVRYRIEFYLKKLKLKLKIKIRIKILVM